jgi:2-iminoacetate synthase
MATLPTMTLSEGAADFVDDARLHGLLELGATDPARVHEILEKSRSLQALTVEETADLLRTGDPSAIEEILETARELKRRVYGDRIVLFAPLYIGNDCVNDCVYCAFRRSNVDAVRRTLDTSEIRAQVTALEGVGHKRLILVFGEHPRYDAEAIATAVREVYATRHGHDEIRRVNVNAAPLDHEGYRTVKAAGIGTYQIFHETYDHQVYGRMHPRNSRKGDYLWRLDGPSRAIEAGCDDVGIGALFGLADWRFDTLGLIAHARHLYERYGVGPHTISFPRIRPAQGLDMAGMRPVSDAELLRLIAILRVSVPYTGMILTARETAEVRRGAIDFGVSQIDGGSRIELGGYTDTSEPQNQAIEREQFTLGDTRSLDDVVHELLESGHVPSFCTACYRVGRTGEVFMEYAIPGFIQRFCTPNALTTLMEYLIDHATPETRRAGMLRIDAELARLEDGPLKREVADRLRRIHENDERDLLL